jgi:hypothetical protein
VRCPGTGAGGLWSALEVMVDNGHGFDVKEIIAKIWFHQKKTIEVMLNLGKAASTI